MKFKKIILGTILSAFLLQGCSAVMALSGGDNPDFKVIAKGSSKAQIEKQPIKAVFSETPSYFTLLVLMSSVLLN